jgi:O-methyltransferase
MSRIIPYFRQVAVTLQVRSRVPCYIFPPPPLASGLTTPDMQYTYAADGLWTVHNAAFLNDPRIRESYALGVNSGHRICPPGDQHIEWRVYVCCWAATHAMKLASDFVEYGVSTGIVSRAVAHYVDFARARDKRFWLVDTFKGIPLEQANPQERTLADSKNQRHYFDCSEDLRRHFAPYGNVEIVKGRVPDILPSVDADPVAYLHIDMNIAEPEVYALAYFWELMTPGGIIIFDDYASMAHVAQKRALDAMATKLGTAILALPTGQGMLLKA